MIAIYRPSALLRSLEPVDADFRQADLHDMNSLRQALKGTDAVIHAAAYYPTTPNPWRGGNREGLWTLLSDSPDCSGVASATLRRGAIQSAFCVSN